MKSLYISNELNSILAIQVGSPSISADYLDKSLKSAISACNAMLVYRLLYNYYRHKLCDDEELQFESFYAHNTETDEYPHDNLEWFQNKYLNGLIDPFMDNGESPFTTTNGGIGIDKELQIAAYCVITLFPPCGFGTNGDLNYTLSDFLGPQTRILNTEAFVDAEITLNDYADSINESGALTGISYTKVNEYLKSIKGLKWIWDTILCSDKYGDKLKEGLPSNSL